MRHYLLLFLACTLLAACNQSPDGMAKQHEKPAVTLDPALGVDPDSFIEGNLYFLGYHELGHALISELDLPVVGREEDAVDRLAIWMMTPEEGEGEPDYLMGAMHGWFLTAAQTPLVKIAWWDEHGSDQQRGYQIACLLYGNDPARFGQAADAAGLPDDRLDSCVNESKQNDSAWSRLIATYQREDSDAAAPNSVTVRYDPTKEYADDQAYLKKSELLENLADLMRNDYRLKPGIRIIGSECGEANSYWDSDSRTLSICYELVRDYRNMASGKTGE